MVSIEKMEDVISDIMVCTACKASLKHDKAENALICFKCGKKYLIRDGIPVFLDKV